MMAAGYGRGGAAVAAGAAGSAAGERPTTLVYSSSKLENGLWVVSTRITRRRSSTSASPITSDRRTRSRPDRVRPPLRAPDVPGQQERPQDQHQAFIASIGGEQCLDERGFDQLLGDGAGALPAAGAVARGRSDGLAQGRTVGVHARAQRGEGGAPAARRQPALRPPRRDRLRRHVHHPPVQAPGDRQHGRPRGGAHRGRARLLRDLLRAGERRARHRR
jgi:hypothetical protein